MYLSLFRTGRSPGYYSTHVPAMRSFPYRKPSEDPRRDGQKCNRVYLCQKRQMRSDSCELRQRKGGRAHNDELPGSPGPRITVVQNRGFSYDTNPDLVRNFGEILGPDWSPYPSPTA